jgi:hypothetical protein
LLIVVRFDESVESFRIESEAEESLELELSGIEEEEGEYDLGSA